MFGEDNPPLEDIAPMTSPTMPTPSTPMQTLIRWRDAKSERPPKDFTWYTVLKKFGDHNTVTRLFYDSGEWSHAGGVIVPNEDVIGWADAHAMDIQTGEFVSVEAVRGLPTYDIVEHQCQSYNAYLIEKMSGGRFVRLSDIEQLGGIG